MPESGTLFVVATPIGNLGDLSPRAAEVLRHARAIFCEDTRVTAKLASRFGLSAPRISCHAHNEEGRIAEVLDRLGRGEDLALVSDAGTPGYSDPGERIVSAAAAAGFRIAAVPGPNAAAGALSISGLPAAPHLFMGFPPPRAAARRAFFERHADRPETLVFFEAPHRLRAALADAASVLGPRRAVLARELTKVHEETLRGTLEEIRDGVAGRSQIRGECVVVVAGASAGDVPAPRESLDAAIDRFEQSGRAARAIARDAARAAGVSSREAYARIVARRSGGASPAAPRRH